MMNIFELPKLPSAEELTTILAKNESIRVERIISTGQISDWYDQEETEFVVLLEGDAKIKFENEKIVDLIKGDTLTIKAHEKHRVYYTSVEPPCVWLCVFWNN